jgi:hypothetical protein
LPSKRKIAEAVDLLMKIQTVYALDHLKLIVSIATLVNRKRTRNEERGN